MKLKTLKASSIRGIPKDWPPLSLGNKGLIVYGPNGVGKSSIIDAIEFALTNRSTLFSKAGKGYNWENASPHVRHGQPEVILSLNDGGTVRDLQAGSQSQNSFSQSAQKWLEIAKKSSFVLRRHMLLRFISEKPRDRYELLEPFFNMEEFIRVEKGLQSLVTNYKSKEANTANSIAALESQLHARFSEPSTTLLSYEFLYPSLNRTLNNLGLPSCSSNQEGLREIKRELAEQLEGKGKTERIGALQNLKKKAQGLGSPHTLIPLLNDFLSSVSALEQERVSRNEETMTEFLSQGHEIIATGQLEACPLCEVAIKDRTTLLQRLSERIVADERITTAKNQVKATKSALTRELRKTGTAITSFIKDWKVTIESTLSQEYPKALEEVRKLLATLDDRSQNYSQLEHYPALIKAASLDHRAVLEIIDQRLIAEGAGERYSLLAKAHSMVEALLDEWPQLKQLSEDRKTIRQKIQYCERLHAYAVKARKEAIQAVVDQVSDTANSFYEIIHPEENIATSKLNVRQAASASVEIKMTFHGEKAHPMRYFSESHLDTLGLCYFLALCKHQTNTTPEFRLLILDDVMHSVDAFHRNRVAELLGTHFNDFQIIITTHDKPFYDMLVRHLKGDYSYKAITGWDIVGGPILGSPATDLDKITKDSIRNDMDENDLAATGGRVLEWLLKELTENLNISVPARFKRKHTLDSLWGPTCTKLKKHKGFNATYPKLASNLDDHVWIRNECGGHHNDTHSGANRLEVQEFGKLIAELYQATYCPDCRRFITSHSNEGWRCSCAKLNYPKTPPTS